MDLGCYPVHWVRTLMGAEPEVLEADGRRGDSGVDIEMRATLGFPGGVRATIATSMAADLPPGHRSNLTVEGQRGRIEVINPLSPHVSHSLTVETEDGSRTGTVPGQSTYHHQLKHVIAVLRGEAEALTGGDDAVGNMQCIQGIFERAGFR